MVSVSRSLVLRVLTCLLLVGACIVLLGTGVSVHTSLNDLLPGGDSPAAKSLERMARAGSRQVNVLIRGEFEDVVWKKAAEISAKLPAGVQPLIGGSSLSAVAEVLHPFRFQLLSGRHRELILRSGASAELRDEALSNLYSFVPVSLFSVDDDPYAFTTSFLMESPLVRQNGFELRDGIMLTRRGNVHYAYLPLQLPLETENSLPLLQETMQKLSECCAGNDVLMAGTPVHTWQASMASQQAITLLSIISAVIVISLFICVFYSLRGMLLMLATLGSAGLLSMAAAAMIHDSVHVLALVFGCSLVGISTDYVVHYLVEHHRNAAAGVSPRLRNALLLGLLTSTIGYSSFYATQVELLFQIATVSVVGLGAAMLFIFAFYPLLLPKHIPTNLSAPARLLGMWVARWRIPAYLPWVCCGLFAALSFCRLEVSDDLRSFYRPEPELQEAEKLVAELNGMAQGVLAVYVQGNDTEQILQRQEQLVEMLARCGVVSCTSVSALVPSAARQKENFALVQQQVRAYENEVPVELPETFEKPLVPSLLMGDGTPFTSLSHLWDSNGGLLLLPASCRAQLSGFVWPEWAEVTDRFADLQNQVKSWRETLMLLLAVVLVLVLTVLSLYAGFRKSWRMLGPVAAGILAVFAGLVLCGKPLTMFHVLACYLVLGLGCDYAIFKASAAADDAMTSLAVLISFITSWAMFGVLAFTDFSVTQDMGVAVSFGLSVAYVLSPAAKGAKSQPCTASCASRK